ncbi:MAG: sulfur carrier protein ThiS [Acidobacteriota bacterium]
MDNQPGLIEVIVNGEPRSVEAGIDLEQLLLRLELPPARVAVERNRRVVPRGRFSGEPVRDGDRLEIVTLVGGG